MTFSFFVGVLTLVTLLFVLGLAALVLAAAPRRGVNQALAALLLLDAIGSFGGILGLTPLLGARAVGYNALLYVLAASLSTCFIYPLFFSFALDTPLTRPLRRRGVRIVLVAAGLLSFAVPILFPHALLKDTATNVPEIGWVFDLNLVGELIGLMLVPVLIYGTVAAVSNYRRMARGTRERSQAKAYLIAFGTQDVGFAAVNTYYVLHPVATTFDLDVFALGLTLTLLIVSVLIATALLRYQVLDFELRLKQGVARGVVAAVFVLAFLVVAQIGAFYLQQTQGYIVAGLATGLLLFAMAPLQRVAGSVADRIFPGAEQQTSTWRPVGPGSVVQDRYRVIQELGIGGSGQTFLAEDTRMSRRVALKILRDPNEASLIREARSAAAVEHPNIVRMYDAVSLPGMGLLIMEFVDGGSLKERIEGSGPLSERAFATLADDLLGALEAVHAAGAVHRDVKPANILFTKDGRAKLSDFGIARLPGYETTVGGSGSGSVQYMSPEQARGKRVTASSDLYSAAVTLYEARMGRPLVTPLPDESALEIRARIAATTRSETDLRPGRLRDWFSRALAPVPDDRYESATSMRKALVDAIQK